MSMSTESSAIHNIGYRRYDGPRLGRKQAIGTIYRQTLRGAFGIGRGFGAKFFPWLLAGSALLPAVILAIVQAATPPDPVLGPQAITELNHYTTFISAVPLLFIASQAPQAFSRDLRFKVLPLYFSRPTTYRDYTHARLLGLWTAVTAILALPLILLYLGGLSASLPAGELTADLVGSLISVVFLTAMLTCIGALVASVTPRRGLGVVAIIAFLAGSYGMAQFLQAMGSALGTEQTAAWMGVFSPVSIYEGVQAFLFQGSPFDFTPSTFMPTPSPAAGAALMLVGFGLVYVCYRLLILRYRKVAAS